MLIILTIFLVISTVIMVFLKKNREMLLLLGLCICLMMEIAGVMIYIAKKGGISYNVMQFFYFTDALRDKFRYLYISLGQLGFLITLGRLFFPYFLLNLALSYSMIEAIRRNNRLKTITLILPVLTTVLYYPSIYHKLVDTRESWQIYLAEGSMIWIVAYLITATVLLMVEYASITIKLCRVQFRKIIISLLALTGIYLLYCRQDPGQVYKFYSSPFAWNRGIGYLQGNPTLISYITLITVSVVCCVMGFYSLFSFTSDNYTESKDDAIIRRKFDTARIGASMFLHSMKNQILSNKVIYKRISNLFEHEPTDMVKLKEYISALENANTNMLNRMEELYRHVKANEIYMVPVSMEEIVEAAVSRFHEKYPDVKVNETFSGEMQILADKSHLSEAVCNIIANGYESMLEAETAKERSIEIKCYNERLYSVIEIKDYGKGMNKKLKKKAFDPFFSSKNSNHNWGMGLYYVREIVKSHLGQINIESAEGRGSSFYIMLPRYK